jgi:hypothetical protein
MQYTGQHILLPAAEPKHNQAHGILLVLLLQLAAGEISSRSTPGVLIHWTHSWVVQAAWHNVVEVIIGQRRCDALY